MSGLEKNTVHNAQITGWSHDGSGVAHVLGRAVFVPRAIPGDECVLRIVKAGSNAVYGRVEELLSPADGHAQPPCPQYGRCGGCALMHMTYEKQLEFKLRHVNDCMRRIGSLELEAEDILPSPERYSWRNKVIYNIGRGENGTVFGFFRQRSHDVVPTERCLLQPEAADAAAATVCRWMDDFAIPAYDFATKKGAVRHVFCRTASQPRGMQVAIVSAKANLPHTEELVRSLREACPEITGILLNVNTQTGNTVFGGTFRTLWGSDRLEDTLCGLKVSLSPRSFYQANRLQAQQLYDMAVEFAGLTGSETVLDLYCGTGTITMCLAKKAKLAIGAEIVPEAIEDARKNATANGLSNTRFICADAGQAAQQLIKEGLRPDVIVVDPPRKGLSPETIEAAVTMAPERIVYVSCDPATLARDLKLFDERGYKAERLRCADMFPDTSHVESCAILSRKRQ